MDEEIDLEIEIKFKGRKYSLEQFARFDLEKEVDWSWDKDD